MRRMTHPMTIQERKQRRRDRLAELLDSRGQAEIGRAAGIDPTYLWQIAKGSGKSARSLSDKNAEKIEDAVGLPRGWFDQIDSSSSTAPVSLPATRPGYVRFPLLEGFAGMGRGGYVGDYPEIVQFVEVAADWAAQRLRGVPPGAVRVITGRGSSMRGMFNDGDPIFLDSRVKQFAGDGVYCFRWNGLVYIKKLQMVGKGQARILSANPDYEPVNAPADELEIGGRAIAAWSLTEF